MRRSPRPLLGVLPHYRRQLTTLSGRRLSPLSTRMDAKIIASLQKLPEFFRYIAVNGTKAPYTSNWQDSRLNLRDFTDAHENDSRCHAVGLLTGEPSGGILSIDHDGGSCDPLIQRLSQLRSVDDALPQTVKFTSGKTGRYQALYWVPSEYWPYISKKTVIATGIKGEQLEFRWNGHQSVIAGKHPETEGYQWVEGCSPDDVDIAPCPEWVLRQIVQNNYELLKSLTNSDRELLVSGSPEGGRNANAFKIACSLIGASNVLADAGKPSGDPRELFDQFCDRCDPPLDRRERETVWRSAQKRDPVPSKPLGDDLEIDPVELRDAVEKDIKTSDDDIQLNAIFPADLAAKLKPLAETFNQPEVLVGAIVLCAASSMLRAGIQLRIGYKSNFLQPATLWASCVGNSDDGKSAILKNIIRPIKTLQYQAYQRYRAEYEEYENDVAKWEGMKKEERGAKPNPPVMRQYVLSDFTTEGLVNVLKHQPSLGILVENDELATFIGSFDKYRKGSNSDRGHWLTSYDGEGVNIIRKSSPPIVVPQTNLCVVGSIQPRVLRDAMGELEHVDGFWPRFLYVRMRSSIMPCIDWDNDEDTGLEELLLKTYTNLLNLSDRVYSLSRACRPIWDEWHNQTETSRFYEFHPAVNAIYRKARARAGRVALVLHCLYAALENREPELDIQPTTLRTAIAVVQFGINQIKSIYSEFGVSDNPDANRIARFIQRFRGTGWITPRQVRNWWYPKTEINATKARNFMTQLVSLGYAIDNGQEGRNYKIKIVDKKSSPSVQNNPNPSQEKDFEAVHNSVHGLSNPVHFSEELDPLPSPWTENGLKRTESGLKSGLDYQQLEPLSSKDLEESGLNGLNGLSSESGILEPSENEVSDFDDQSPVHPVRFDESDPREAITRSSTEISVNLDKISLSYEPSVQIPDWQPVRQVKPYEQVKKLYLDIETTGLDPESDRVIMIGLLTSQGECVCLSDMDEAALLKNVLDYLKQFPPDILVGHNLFNFDLPFIMERCRHHKIRHPFKRDDRARTISASSFHGKPIEYTPIRLPGVQIVDTFHQVAIWDKSASKLTSYGLKNSVIALGLRSDRRLELSVDQIRECWQTGNLKTVAEYLTYDLEDTRMLADFLLPVVWYQQNWVPGLSFQELAVASPALKAQKIHESLGLAKVEADQPVKYGGGLVECHTPGLHRNVAKIDVSSLYPSIMLRYAICSRKDPQHKFLAVMRYMTLERLRFKALAKSGDKLADQQQGALKILINGSYGFLGTGGYSYNDMEAASLVTAYGRKILMLMQQVCTDHGAKLIESDTDGIMFSSETPQGVYEAVQKALPDGINIELEMSDCGVYVPKAKSYVIVHPSGKVTVKGLFRKRDRYPLQNTFPIEFIKRYFLDSPEVAEAYYQGIRSQLETRLMDISQLTITRKIRKGEKTLVELGIGMEGDTVSYWYGEQKRYHSKNKNPLKSIPVETQTGDYWAEFYIKEIDQLHADITGVQAHQKATRDSNQLSLEA